MKVGRGPEGSLGIFSRWVVWERGEEGEREEREERRGEERSDMAGA